MWLHYQQIFHTQSLHSEAVGSDLPRRSESTFMCMGNWEFCFSRGDCMNFRYGSRGRNNPMGSPKCYNCVYPRYILGIYWPRDMLFFHGLREVVWQGIALMRTIFLWQHIYQRCNTLCKSYTYLEHFRYSGLNMVYNLLLPYSISLPQCHYLQQ